MPRLPQKVSDLATRYTPLEIPRSPPRSGDTAIAQSSLSADRFPTFQDKYPQAVRDKDRFKVSPTLERPYLDDRDKGRYRYAEAPAVDRNQFLRDDRDRSPHHPPRSRSPDQGYFDEMEAFDRQQQRKIDEVVGLLSLQEREANLREQERRLEFERARIVNAREEGYASDTHAREGGYTSDTSRSRRGVSPYGRPRRSESPGPMTSQQSLRPYDLPSPHERPRRSESPGPMTSQQSLRPYDHTSPYERSGRSRSPSPMTSQQPLRPYDRFSPYERSRRPESPSPMPSLQPSGPYDHSPNCGCQHCSAKHYASNTSLPRGRDSTMPQQQTSYVPDSQTLRSEKPKGWLRRMSMPLVPSTEKNLSVPSLSGLGGRKHATPEEVRRVGRRSFDFEDQETAGRFGETTRE